jgi:hypothetical protein
MLLGYQLCSETGEDVQRLCQTPPLGPFDVLSSEVADRVLEGLGPLRPGILLRPVYASTFDVNDLSGPLCWHSSLESAKSFALRLQKEAIGGTILSQGWEQDADGRHFITVDREDAEHVVVICEGEMGGVYVVDVESA